MDGTAEPGNGAAHAIAEADGSGLAVEAVDAVAARRGLDVGHLPPGAHAFLFLDLDHQGGGVDIGTADRQFLTGGAGAAADLLAAKRLALLGHHRIHPRPGNLQRRDPRLGQRSQPDPGDQPCGRHRIVDPRRPVADAGPDVGEHVVAGNAEIVGPRKQQSDHAGANQACGAVGERLQRQIFVALAGAGADLPDVRDRGARGDRLQRRRNVDRRCEADGQRDAAVVLAAAQSLAHRRHVRGFRCRREQRHPQAFVEGLGDEVAAGRFGGAVDEDRCRDIGRGPARDAVQLLKIGDQAGNLPGLAAVGPALDVATTFDRLDSQLGLELEMDRLGDGGARRQRHRSRRRRIGDRDLDKAAGGQGRPHLLAEETQESEPLPLGNEVGAEGMVSPSQANRSIRVRPGSPSRGSVHSGVWAGIRRTRSVTRSSKPRSSSAGGRIGIRRLPPEPWPTPDRRCRWRGCDRRS
jgi:hypothetical protein